MLCGKLTNRNGLAIFSFVNGTSCANDGQKRIRERDNTMSNMESSSSFTATSTAAPADALEGRKLALKRLQEKLEQFKGIFSYFSQWF